MGLAVKKAVPLPAPPKMDSRQNHELEDLSVLPLCLEPAGGELQRLCISRCLFILQTNVPGETSDPRELNLLIICMQASSRLQF